MENLLRVYAKINMRKIHKIWYVICIGVSLFISLYLFKSGIDGKAWFRYASKFDQAGREMMANDLAKKGTGMRDLAKTYKMGQKFLRAKQPTETEIISVLTSPDKKVQKIGLAAMSLKPIETDRLIDILFEFMRDSDPEFRWYSKASLLKFTKFPEVRKPYLGKQLLEMVKNEKENEFALEDFLLLAKFPSVEAALFLTEQLMKEGKEKQRLFRYIAFKSLKEMGDSYYDQAAEYVNAHSSPEIKEELLGWEKWYEEKNQSEKNRNIFKSTR